MSADTRFPTANPGRRALQRQPARSVAKAGTAPTTIRPPAPPSAPLPPPLAVVDRDRQHRRQRAFFAQRAAADQLLMHQGGTGQDARRHGPVDRTTELQHHRQLMRMAAWRRVAKADRSAPVRLARESALIARIRTSKAGHDVDSERTTHEPAGGGLHGAASMKDPAGSVGSRSRCSTRCGAAAGLWFGWSGAISEAERRTPSIQRHKALTVRGPRPDPRRVR